MPSSGVSDSVSSVQVLESATVDAGCSNQSTQHTRSGPWQLSGSGVARTVLQGVVYGFHQDASCVASYLLLAARPLLGWPLAIGRHWALPGHWAGRCSGWRREGNTPISKGPYSDLCVPVYSCWCLFNPQLSTACIRRRACLAWCEPFLLARGAQRSILYDTR